MTDYRQLYQEYHEQNPFQDFGECTFLAPRAEESYSDATSVLDFGCGNGYAVKRMRAEGRPWHGLEYSQAAYEQHLRDEPHFFAGDTKQFADRQFDMGYSTEVFEHIPEEIVAETVADFCRVVNRYLFLTISLRPSSDNNKYHCTLKPRAWWEAQFEACGFDVDHAIINLHQRRTVKSTAKILSSWANLGPACREFAENPPYELHGEKQFWYFCFRRQGVPAPPLPKPSASWRSRKLVPWIRRLANMDNSPSISTRRAA